MTRKIIGWIVFAQSRKNLDSIDPLSYGIGEQPYPDQLLRRGACHLFATQKAAASAITKTLAESADMPWVKSFRLIAMPVYGEKE